MSFSLILEVPMQVKIFILNKITKIVFGRKSQKITPLLLEMENIYFNMIRMCVLTFFSRVF